jgi:O-succinylbenzoic acid--CoA ligase
LINKSVLPNKFSFSDSFQQKDFVLHLAERWAAKDSHFNLTSSGSTGTPKPVQLKRTLLEWSAKQNHAFLDLKDEGILCCLPVEKTGGFMQIIRALIYDWPIHFEEPTANPLENLKPHEYSFTSFTPMQLQHVFETDAHQLKTFKNILIGGAAVSDHLEKSIHNFNTHFPTVIFWETYGMTETASHVGLRNISKNEPFFTPLNGVEISSANDCLFIAIPEVDLQFQTNDLVEITNDKFAILGRSDNAINSGGVKILPEVIEPKIKEVLLSLRIDRPLYLTKKTDTSLGEKAVLILEGVPITDTTFILEILKRELPAYHAPKEILFVDEIDYTDTGKVIRKQV